jgi:hypothetical protein
MGFISGTGTLGVAGEFAAILLSIGSFEATVSAGLGVGTPEVLETFAAIGSRAIQRLT